MDTVGGRGRAHKQKLRVYVHMITELLCGYMLLLGDIKEGEHMYTIYV